MSDARPRVVTVHSGAPWESPFLWSKFHGLADRGWDIRAVYAGTSRVVGNRPPVGSPEALLKRVRRSAPTHSRLLAVLLSPWALSTALLRNPAGTLRYVARGWRKFGIRVLAHLYLDAMIVSEAPDVLHFEFGTLAIGRMHLGDFLNCATVVSFRGFDLNYFGLDQPDCFREIWERADVIHVLGRDLWARAQRRGCPSDKRHAIIAPAVDLDRFTRRAPRRHGVAGSHERLRILSVGRLVWKKGYEYALRAIRILEDEGVACEYRIVGDGDQFEALSFTSHRLGIEKSVALVGTKDHSGVLHEMEESDLFLHAAVSEGFCNAVLEAQAMELPVVTSDADGLAENVADGETGFVVGRRDPSALAAKLLHLSREVDVRRRMGEAGRIRIAAQFQLRDQLDAFERLYRDAAAEAIKLT